jgi:hypothetical protein
MLLKYSQLVNTPAIQQTHRETSMRNDSKKQRRLVSVWPTANYRPPKIARKSTATSFGQEQLSWALNSNIAHAPADHNVEDF